MSETWAAGYFQVAASLVLFGVGIPALVMQFVGPEDVRRLVHRQVRLVVISLTLLALLMGTALAFLWVLRPCDSLDAQFQGNLSRGLITIALALLVVAWALQWHYLRRDPLSLISRKGLVRKWLNRYSDGVALEDLRFLCEHVHTYEERVKALSLLEQFAGEVQNQRGYEGNGLVEIIDAVEAIAQRDGDVLSLCRGVATLRRIGLQLRRCRVQHPADAGAVLRALGRLAASTASEDPSRALPIVGTIGDLGRAPGGPYLDACLALLELGKSSLKSDEFILAAAALRKLEVMARRNGVNDGIGLPSYLGLAAHFWSHGASARTFADASLKRITFVPSRQECLRLAREDHFGACRFDTADSLGALIRG